MTLLGNEPEFVKVTHTRWPYVEMLVSSLIGLVASLVLSIEAITLAANPNAIFSCDISAKVSCSVVGTSWQANLFGFPNSFLGLIAEPVVITLAVAALGGTRFPKWFMNLALAVYGIGLAFAVWLFIQAYFVIGSLCPWCLLITVTTTTVFIAMTRVCLLDNTVNLPARAHAAVTRWLRIGVDIWVTGLLLAVLVAAIIYRYI